jgi:hypothetical protein
MSQRLWQNVAQDPQQIAAEDWRSLVSSSELRRQIPR